MKSLLKVPLLFFLLLAIGSCNTKATKLDTTEDKRVTIEMVTEMGTMTIELYNETPKHRDNFMKLANEGAYDSVLFHRVINQFMIQAGDPDSKNAKTDDALGNGDKPYKVAAEFHPDFFHKKGALGAARDGNPERASSAMQFYIAQGKVKNDSLIDKDQKRINKWLASHYSNLRPENKTLLDSLQKTNAEDNYEQYSKIEDKLDELAENFTDFEKYTIPESHREVYRTLGGTPHLDQNYTVFGEVIKGLEVLDSIAVVETGFQDRPKQDVRILSVRIIE
jgi:cyclophilin family peptidyl-prolyl cis-trans isomerase|tara:strand:- start:824 stop:1660 length:837 start_codon:yes stop_codon:yes gene_type:complete